MEDSKLDSGDSVRLSSGTYVSAPAFRCAQGGQAETPVRLVTIGHDSQIGTENCATKQVRVLSLEIIES